MVGNISLGEDFRRSPEQERLLRRHLSTLGADSILIWWYLEDGHPEKAVALCRAQQKAVANFQETHLRDIWALSEAYDALLSYAQGQSLISALGWLRRSEFNFAFVLERMLFAGEDRDPEQNQSGGEGND